MKKSFIRPLAILLCCCLLLPCALTSCGSEKLLELDGVSIDADLYRYWLGSFKRYFLRNYADVEDTPESWSKTMADGRTVAQYVEEYTRNYAENALCALALCRKYGITVPADKKQEISEYIDEIVTYRFDGVRSDFAAELQKNSGITVDKLREAYELEAKITALKEYLFSKDGPASVGEEELEAYYKAQYLHFQFLYINTEFGYVLDENGKYKTDPETGYYLTPALTDEERAEKLARLEEAKARIEKGESFADVAAAYGEFDTSKDAPEGFYVRRSAYGELLRNGYSATVLQALFMMQPGEMKTVTERDMSTNYPGSFLLLSLPLADHPYSTGSDATKAQFSDLREQAEGAAFNELLAEMLPNITADEEKLAVFTVENVRTGLSYLN